MPKGLNWHAAIRDVNLRFFLLLHASQFSSCSNLPAIDISAIATMRTFAFSAHTLHPHQSRKIVVRDRRCKFCFLHSSFKKVMHYVCDRPAAALNWLCVLPSLEGFEVLGQACALYLSTPLLILFAKLPVDYYVFAKRSS